MHGAQERRQPARLAGVCQEENDIVLLDLRPRTLDDEKGVAIAHMRQGTHQFVEFRGIFARRFHLARSRKAVSGHRNGHFVAARLHAWKHATQRVGGRSGLWFAAIQAVGEFEERLVDGGFGQGFADAGSAIEERLRARLLLTCRTGLEYETRPLSTSVM